jgi:hypothetical protein
MHVHAIFVICFPKGEPLVYSKFVQKGVCKLELHGEKGFTPSSNVHGLKVASNYMLV